MYPDLLLSSNETYMSLKYEVIILVLFFWKHGTNQFTQCLATGKTVATGFKSTDLFLILEEKFQLVQLLAAKHTGIKNTTTLTDHDTVLPYSCWLVL